MSEVNASDLRLIESPDDVIHLYKGAGNDSMIGVEVELGFFDPKSLDLAIMSVCQNKVVKNAVNDACGSDFARNEPTSEMLEIGSIPGGPSELKAIMKDAQHKIECLTQKASDIGLKRSYFQHLPDKTAAELLDNLMDVDRYQAFFGPPREDMQAVAAYFSVCKSNQVSVSYRDHNHMLDNVRRLYALSPFLFMITDNAAAFNEGQPFTGNAGMHHRAALGSRGSVPSYLYTAKTGEEYIHSHIDNVMNNPLFVYYDEKGEMIRLPSGTFTSFNELRDQGLNTATNYFFSQSILWPDIKIAALRNKQNEIVNHRYEARMFGVGVHQHQTALLIMAALAFDSVFAQKVDEILGRYGFDLSNPESLKTPLETAYKAARQHNEKFLDIPYGQGTMADFAKNFADLIQNASLMGDYEDELSPLLTICRTGCTDSKVNALLFDTLDKAKDFQRSYDQKIFENPGLCARTLFKKQISTHPQRAETCSTV